MDLTKKPGRPTNIERTFRGLAEGVTQGVVQSNPFTSAIDSRLKQHTGHDIADYTGWGIRSIASRIK